MAKRKLSKAELRAAKRWLDSPLYAWTRSRSDEQGLYAKSKSIYACVNGPNRSGKTFAICSDACLVIEGMHDHRSNYKGGDYLVLLPSRRQAAEIWGRYMLSDCKLDDWSGKRGFWEEGVDVKVEWDASAQPKCPKVITHLRTGKRLHFALSNSPTCLVQIKGLDLHGVWIDESAGTIPLIEEVRQRVKEYTLNDKYPDAGFIH